MVTHRYAQANNPLVEAYDPSRPTRYLQYLDANNLYGWAMSQPLPMSDFKWVEVNLDDVLSLSPESSTGYILECDLAYPSHLHDSHNDFPLAPETLTIKEEWLSPYQRNLAEQLKSSGLNAIKLTPNLMDKQRYVLHYRNLILYTQLGLRVTKVHRVLSFTQAPWMEGYIQKNTELRQKAQNDFEKSFFKAMNNMVFGKTMENVRHRVNIKLVRGSEEKKIKKMVAKPTYKRHAIFDNDLVGIEFSRQTITLAKPIYVGMTVLDLSKHLMYDFFYNELKVSP